METEELPTSEVLRPAIAIALTQLEIQVRGTNAPDGRKLPDALSKLLREFRLRLCPVDGKPTLSFGLPYTEWCGVLGVKVGRVRGVFSQLRTAFPPAEADDDPVFDPTHGHGVQPGVTVRLKLVMPGTRHLLSRAGIEVIVIDGDRTRTDEIPREPVQSRTVGPTDEEAAEEPLLAEAARVVQYTPHLHDVLSRVAVGSKKRKPWVLRHTPAYSLIVRWTKPIVEKASKGLYVLFGPSWHWATTHKITASMAALGGAGIVALATIRVPLQWRDGVLVGETKIVVTDRAVTAPGETPATTLRVEFEHDGQIDQSIEVSPKPAKTPGLVDVYERVTFPSHGDLDDYSLATGAGERLSKDAGMDFIVQPGRAKRGMRAILWLDGTWTAPRPSDYSALWYEVEGSAVQVGTITASPIARKDFAPFVEIGGPVSGLFLSVEFPWHPSSLSMIQVLARGKQPETKVVVAIIHPRADGESEPKVTFSR